jgi:hypothetical protein
MRLGGCMDMRAFYQKARQIAETIAEAYAVVISLPTPDGGREGIASEVAKALAALLIVEGKARLATAEESQNFRDRAAEAKAAADRLVTASKVQITVLSDADFRALKGSSKKG